MPKKPLVSCQLIPPSMNPLPTISGFFQLGTTSLPYVLHRSGKRKRTIAFSFEPELTLRISAPLRTKFSVIENIVAQRSSWFLRKLVDIKTLNTHALPRSYSDGDALTFLGKKHLIKILHLSDNPMGCFIEDNQLFVNIHGHWTSKEDLRQEVRFEIISWFKKQARAHLKDRLDFWSTILDVQYRRFILTSPEARWGSCDFKNNIRINWRVMIIPPNLIDYVVVHELCHIMHKNHSRQFWNYLEKYMPDYDERRKQLKHYGSHNQFKE